MNMINLLPAMRIAVHDQPVTFICYAVLGCQFTRHGKQPAKRGFMFGLNIINGWNKLIGHQ